jgi:hypothetical protein
LEDCFRIGSLGEAPSLICKNHKSATDNPVKVFEKLAKESLKKRIAWPFKNPPIENFTCYPLGLVPKSEHGKFRLIHDLSFPKGNSVNSNILPSNTLTGLSVADLWFLHINDGASPNDPILKPY